ncbi:VCBS repeat-containing protein [Streptomyces pharetrae]|uniref:FG-GAP repeat domain-containing protein n=1 Tax=Streptomyces pharetrae TaxID=291370 RepID=UPI00335220E0
MSLYTRALKKCAIAALVAAAVVTGMNTLPAADSATDIKVAPVAAATTSSVNGPITRAEILERAQYWVDKAVPYSQSAWTGDSLGKNYRTDCSGFVSLAWHLSDSKTTWTLPSVSTRLSSLDQLKPGDALNNIDRHVVLFIGWTDSTHTTAIVQEQPRPGLTARQTTYSRSYIVNDGFLPYRYNKVVEEAPTPTDTGMTNLVGGNFGSTGNADIVAVEAATGKLFYYPGASGGKLGTRAQIGSNWDTMGELTSGQFTADTKLDLAAVDNQGVLWIYPGNGNGTFGTRWQAGTNWDNMRDLAGADVNKDGKDDILAVESATGNLYAYPSTGTGGLGVRVQIGSNWNGMDEIVSPGDMNKDGKDDIVAREVSTGNLYVYPGTGTTSGGDALGNRVQIGSNWDSMTNLVSGDFNNDGVGDVDAVQARVGDSGTLYTYPGTGVINGTATLGARVQIGTNW